ncbi:GNAT family N-acetyltransferase [Pseudonocardia sp. Ae505_Ps2]|uniref:GNAT family N-acetyltransferase n=1 Tax=Pseudonocardia sp. Ae505_Ps2 TaxID=1885034 RepID=UPI000A01DF24|nr:GNAT family N-acetyltransferase [Pseudonocardia sp. Ae505_Ps2]
MGQATLETSRLLLTPLAEEHLELEVAVDSDPEVMRYLTGRPSPRKTVEAQHRRRLAISQNTPGFGLWAGFTAGQFVGWWLLHPSTRPESAAGEGEVELGYRLLRRFWRQGLASEGARELIRHAFDDLGLSRVFAETMAVNTASRATMNSVGLHYQRTVHREWDYPLRCSQ